MKFRLKTKGFTLLELLISVAIVGILTALAYPSYERYIQDGRRSDAQQEMLETAVILERFYSRNGGYPDSDTFTDLPVSTGYTYAYQNTDKPENAANFRSLGFQLSATPNGAQIGDRCGVLSINHQGETTASGNGNDCWK